MILTVTSPVRFSDESPYNVPLARGLLFSLVFVLFLVVVGFFVVDFVGCGLGFVCFVGGLGVFVGCLGVFVGGFVLIVVGLAFELAAASRALDCIAFWINSPADSGVISLTSGFSSLVFSGISVDVCLISPRAVFFFLFDDFLEIITSY